MKSNFQQYENSLTRQVELAMNQWSKELADMSTELMNDPMSIVDALNDRRNICTPGFLMRRQLQENFSELLESVSKETGEVYSDLFISNNIPWPEKFVKCLSSKLEKHAKTQDQTVKASQWKAWLNDESFPAKRELAVKLSFLLDMDDYVSTKFLLSCGHEPFSVRNPLDCICLFCKQIRPKGTWEKVEELLNEYEKNRPGGDATADTCKMSVGGLGKTRMISAKIPELAGASTPEYQLENLQHDLITYMCSMNSEFTHRKRTSKKDTKTDRPYLSGYSLERCQNLLELTKYLAVLYPGYDNAVYEGGDRRTDLRTKKKGTDMLVSKIIYSEEIWKNIEIKENGYPNLLDLSRAFVYSRDWDFAEPSGLGLVDINPKTGKAYKTSSKKETHDKIPFNKDVYMICKAYAENNRLSAIALMQTQIENAVPVERKDILLLAYLFISEYSRQKENTDIIKQLYKIADTNNNTDSFSYEINSILGQLESTVNMWDDYEKISGYISCINQFLQLFDFQEFYPPFLLDRFILFALVGEEIGSAFLTDDGLPENLTGIWLYDGYADGTEKQFK